MGTQAIVQSLSRNQFETIVVKNYAKADIKMFYSGLVQFFLNFLLFHKYFYKDCR